MCILLKFNQRPQWSYQEIADETEIPERDLMRAMQSLTMGKIGQRVLARTGEGSKVRKKRRHETACRVHRTLYRRDPNKSGGGTQSFSITPYSLYGSSNLLSCYGGLHLGWIQLAPPWRFLNFHLEHPQIFKIEEKNGFNFLRVQRVILQNLRVF